MSHSRSRLFVLLLLLCAAVVAQSFALELEHQQHNSSQHCCLLCHVGPVPLVQAAVTSTAAPLLTIAWLPPASEWEGKHDVLLAADSSRAPPVHFASPC